jgi:hypothetical protein
MKKSLTPDDLVLFIYEEISNPQERNDIEQAIKADNEMYELYNSFAEIRETLDKSVKSPLNSTIRNLLNYSKALSVMQTKDHKKLGLVMN